MRNLFNSILVKKQRRNLFDLSHDKKMSMNIGEIVPTTWFEAYPGDKLNLNSEWLARLAPTIAPFMHRVDMYCHYWFVPYRLLWPNWEKWITNTKVADVLPAHPVVRVASGNTIEGSLLDYLGIPPLNAKAGFYEVNAMPLAAYQFVYNEMYRDQDLCPEVDWELIDGNNTANTDLFSLRRRAYGHDYFTSAAPWPQKGDAVNMPITVGNLPVKFNTPADPDEVTVDTSIDGVPVAGGVIVPHADVPDIDDSRFFADASESQLSGTINDLRRATKLQEWLELAARAGTRYAESIAAFFGVKPEDARLQRPEYITGSVSPLVVSEVLNTTGTVSAPQGNMAGHTLSVGNGYGKSYFVKEHGIVMCVCSIRPRSAYQQGIDRQWLTINDPFEKYWSQFAHIGEQAIQNLEVYANTDTAPTATWGYNARYAEHKYRPSQVAGSFRSTLDFWHLGRIFETPPTLSQEFIEIAPDMQERIFAVQDGTHPVYIAMLHKIMASRQMPKFGTPSF